MIDEEEKKCIGIIFGGNSNEHNISINSAKNIYKAFLKGSNKKNYSIKLFYISNTGVWFNNQISKKILTDNGETFKKVSNNFTANTINFLEDINFNDVDVWFPIIHGLNGEDGTMQGLLKLTRKPFVGSGILGSAIGMDKIAMKLICSKLRIPQVNYFPIQLQKQSKKVDLEILSDQITEKLKFPLFVKPANSGSSLGISKVWNKSQTINGLQNALSIDSRIIVEEGYEVRELECGLIGKSNLKTSFVGEVKYNSEWYDYESKYNSENEVVIPAEIDKTIENKIKAITLKSCQALNIYGFARADFFLEKKTNKIFLNEINTIPGFTNKSMFPMLWRASGLEIDQLVAKIVDIANDTEFYS